MFDSEVERVRAAFPIPETQLVGEVGDMKSNLLKIVLSETALGKDYLPNMVKILDKKIAVRLHRLSSLNESASQTHNEILAREVGKEISGLVEEAVEARQQEGADNQEVLSAPVPSITDLVFEVPRKIEKLTQKYFQQAKGPTIHAVFQEVLLPEISKLLQKSVKGVSEGLNARLGQRELEVSQLQGKYEAAQELLIKQKEMTQQLINEHRIARDHSSELHEKRIAHLQKLLEESNARGRLQPNPEKLVQHLAEAQSSGAQKEALGIVLRTIEELRDEQSQSRQQFQAELERMRTETESARVLEQQLQAKNQFDQLRLEHEQQLQAARLEKQGEVDFMAAKIRQLERREAELTGLVQKREAEVQVLQGKIAADEGLKETQIQFSSLVCNVN